MWKKTNGLMQTQRSLELRSPSLVGTSKPSRWSLQSPDTSMKFTCPLAKLSIHDYSLGWKLSSPRSSSRTSWNITPVIETVTGSSMADPPILSTRTPMVTDLSTESKLWVGKFLLSTMGLFGPGSPPTLVFSTLMKTASQTTANSLLFVQVVPTLPTQTLTVMDWATNLKPSLGSLGKASLTSPARACSIPTTMVWKTVKK